jgi:hypothetical protein
MGTEGIAPRITNHGARWKCAVSYTVQSLYLQGNCLLCIGHAADLHLVEKTICFPAANLQLSSP